MQEVWKARKDAHTGKKAHFFYRISRKEGNKGNKNGGEKKKEGKDAEKTTEGKIIRRHGDTPMVAGCSPKMTGFFNSSPFKRAGRTKRNGRNGFLEILCLTNQLYPKKHQAKKQKPASHIRLGVSTQTPRRIKKTPKHFKANA